MDLTTLDFAVCAPLPYTILLTEEEQLREGERSAEESGCEPLCRHLGRAAPKWLSCKHWLEEQRQPVLIPGAPCVLPAVGPRVPKPHSSLRHPDWGRPGSSIVVNRLRCPPAIDTIPSPAFHKSL